MRKCDDSYTKAVDAYYGKAFAHQFIPVVQLGVPGGAQPLPSARDKKEKKEKKKGKRKKDIKRGRQ